MKRFVESLVIFVLELSTLFNCEVLKSSTMSVVRNLVELDELASSLCEEKCLERKGVSLLSAVLQSLVNNLLPGPGGILTEEYLELLHAAVSVVSVVSVDQLHHVDILRTAQ